VHFDAEIEQLEVAAAVVQINGRGVHLVLIRHDIDAVTFLVGDQRMKRDVVVGLFLSQQVTSGVGRACFQGKTIGGANRGKIGLQGDVVIFFSFRHPRLYWQKSTRLLRSAGY